MLFYVILFLPPVEHNNSWSGKNPLFSIEKRRLSDMCSHGVVVVFSISLHHIHEAAASLSLSLSLSLSEWMSVLSLRPCVMASWTDQYCSTVNTVYSINEQAPAQHSIWSNWQKQTPNSIQDFGLCTFDGLLSFLFVERFYLFIFFSFCFAQVSDYIRIWIQLKELITRGCIILLWSFSS